MTPAAGDPFLLSARQAMRYAVELASNPTPAAIDLERARVWVLIAHELRIGERPTVPFPRPLDRGALEAAGVPQQNIPTAHFGDESLLPVCEEVGPNDPEGALVVYDLRDVTCHACLRVVKERDLAEQIAREDTPVARHAEYEAGLDPYAGNDTTSYRTVRIALPEDTAVLRHAPAGEAPLNKCGNCGHHIEVDLTNVPAIWRHVMTRQAVCPVSNPDQTHSFATPLVDARG